MANINGTTGNDTLTGPDGQDNLIHGFQGDDVLIDGNGNSSLHGSAGADTITPGAGNDTMSGGPDDDVFVITPGSGSNEILDFTPGEDRIDISALGITTFAALQDLLFQNGPNAEIRFPGGERVILTDVHLRDLGADDLGVTPLPFNVITGTSGDDVRFATDSPDQMDGLAGNDQLNGRNGDDVLNGGAGNDMLFGELGDDTLTGGTGGDFFFYGPGDGEDTITDFNPAEGDRLLLGDFHFNSFSEVSPFVSVVGSDTVLDFGEGDRLILQNFTGLNSSHVFTTSSRPTAAAPRPQTLWSARRSATGCRA